MLNLVLFGPPGAGKGTQSERLLKHFGLEHISTGDLLRNEICLNTELGKEAKRFMDEGELVPDAVVIGMIEHRLDEKPHAEGFIFDGFPRTVAQAEALDDLLKKRGLSITAMLSLEVEHEELVKRLLKRGETSGRTDDTFETVNKRINVYERETRPVAEHYQKQGKLNRIHGEGGIEEIFNRIRTAVEKLGKKV